ncbi:MAG: DUF159 family protein [Rickettsiales bacterium]|nr:DUF159 family protein [Rickettsiales bacterium]|tara:strand:+ start:2243 stop:2806 length:564 start_codon:yes stop_codon:yes gene_type:complete
MCGRYALFDLSKSKIKKKINIIPNYNIVPGSNVLLINNKNELFYLPWSLRFSWSKSFNVINARSETLHQKKIFKNTKRCIFVANGYYEWKKGHNKKTPYYHTFFNKNIYFAGLFNDYGACIVTRMSYSNTMRIHKRQPVLLKYNEFPNWFLGTHNFECKSTKKLKIIEVSTQVNFPSNNKPDNIIGV